MNKIFFFDIDGTLLPYKSHQVLDSTKYAIGQLLENGYEVYIATGKSHQAAVEIANELGIKNMITNNGETIHQDSKVVFERYISDTDMKSLVKIAQDNDLGLGFQGNDDYYVLTDRNYSLVADFFESVSLMPPRIEQELITDFKAAQMWFIADNVDVEVPKHLKLVPWRFGGCDISRIDSSKGNAISNFFDISKYESYAFGDGENDLEMFDVVDVSVAMKNSCDAALKHAKYTCDRDDQDGIYKFLVERKLIKEMNV